MRHGHSWTWSQLRTQGGMRQSVGHMVISHVSPSRAGHNYELRVGLGCMRHSPASGEAACGTALRRARLHACGTALRRARLHACGTALRRARLHAAQPCVGRDCMRHSPASGEAACGTALRRARLHAAQPCVGRGYMRHSPTDDEMLKSDRVSIL